MMMIYIKIRSRRYPAEVITGAYYADNLTLHKNTYALAKGLLHSLEQAARGISLYVNSDKTEFICFVQDRAISTLDNKPMKLVDHFTYLGSSISSTESDVNKRIEKLWTAIDKLTTI